MNNMPIKNALHMLFNLIKDSNMVADYSEVIMFCFRNVLNDQNSKNTQINDGEKRFDLHACCFIELNIQMVFLSSCLKSTDRW